MLVNGVILDELPGSWVDATCCRTLLSAVAAALRFEKGV